MAQLQPVLSCLQHTQGPDPQGIRQAEDQLKAFAQQPGYGCVLAQIALSPPHEVPAHLRQLAAVLLKQYVKQHWVAGERGYEPPETTAQDKVNIRSTIPAGLRDPDSKIRTAIAMAIAAIANWDWPQEWPGLLEHIVSSIKQGSDPVLVAGCLRCLSIMAVDLDSEQAPQLLQALSAELSTLVTSPNTPPGLSATCFNIMAQLTSALANLSGAFQRQVRDLLTPLVLPWVHLVCGVLGSDSSIRATWPQKLAALRLGHAIALYFSKPLAAAMPQLMGASWQLLMVLEPLHQSLLVEGCGGEDGDVAEGAEGDEEVVSLAAVISQLFELLSSFVGKAQFNSQVQAGLKQLVYVSIAYLQMTQEQAEVWIHSSSQFVEDEEEDVTNCRACAQLLISDVSDMFMESGALGAVFDGVAQRWAQADAAAAAGKSSWWQMREAGLLAVSACNVGELDPHSSHFPAQQVHHLMEQLLQRDLQPLLHQQQQLGDAGQQFVMARALLLAAQLHEAANPQHREHLLRAAAAAVMSSASSPPLRLLGYKALALLIPAGQLQQLVPLLDQLLPSLLLQLSQADEESLHLVLELLQVVVQGAAGPGSPGLSPQQALAVAQPFLQVWLQHTSDPLISPDAQDVIDALSRHPQCLPSLVQATTPTLAAILQRGAALRLSKQQQQPVAAASIAGVPEETPMLIEASLELLGALVKPGQDASNLELCQAVVNPVLALIRLTHDSSELNSALVLLVKLLRTVPAQQLLPCAASNPENRSQEAGLAALLAVAWHTVAPRPSDGMALPAAAGAFLVQLVKLWPNQLCGPWPAELSSCGDTAPAGASCVAVLTHGALLRLASGTFSPATVARLLEFFVQLVLLPGLGAQGALDVLYGMAVVRPDGSSTNGLALLLPLWLEHATDISGSLQTKQCAAALIELLKLRNHPTLAGLMVQGRLLESEAVSRGRLTRARAKQQGGLQYSQVPAPAKILQVLGALLSAEAEAAGDVRGPDEDIWGAGGSDDSSDASYGEAGVEEAALEHVEFASVLKASGLNGSASRENFLHEVMERSTSATPAPDDDPWDAQDPLTAINLRNIIGHGLSALAAVDPGFFTASAEQLGPSADLEALRALLTR